MIAHEPDFDPSATSDWWLVPGRFFDGLRLRREVAVRVSAGRIARVDAPMVAGSDSAPVWRTDSLVAPGYFDVQVNGGGGALFNTSPTVEGLRVIGDAHAAGGTTSFLPTLITDAPDVMDRAADAVIKAMGQFGVAGVHLEGPHISIAKKGAHNPDFIRPMDERTHATVGRLREALVPVLVTLAPECVPSGAISRLCAMGAVVALGHTNADAATARAAFAEGATSVTHLYNAMTPITSREPGVVGAALDADVYCGFIADGHHVDDTVLALAFRARRRSGRMVVVSDAMPTWNGPDSFNLYGERIQLKTGKLLNKIGSLAGVHMDMATSVSRLVHNVGLSIEEALAAGTSAPAAMMGLGRQIGNLVPGCRSDMVILDNELSVEMIIR